MIRITNVFTLLALLYLLIFGINSLGLLYATRAILVVLVINYVLQIVVNEKDNF